MFRDSLFRYRGHAELIYGYRRPSSFRCFRVLVCQRTLDIAQGAAVFGYPRPDAQTVTIVENNVAA